MANSTIQILGLREYFNQKTQKTQKKESFFSNNWRVNTEEEIFSNIDKIIEAIPENERYNLYFTEARCFDNRGRVLAEQWLIPFDIDDIDAIDQEEGEKNARIVAELAIEILGLDFEKTAVVYTGNGVQFHVKMKGSILSEDFFDTYREHYKFYTDKIQLALDVQDIKGRVDSSVFSSGRLMRLPNTINKKKDKDDKRAVIIQGNLEPQDFDLTKIEGFRPSDVDEIHPNILKKYPKPDSEYVLKECEFLKNCFSKPQETKEPEWYAALSIVSRLENGEQLAHEMSQGHKAYNQFETDTKIQQALKFGPRTCKDINERWNGCKDCKHFSTDLVSPILIRGPSFIKSKDFGYREIITQDNGMVKAGKPVYADLIKEFSLQHPYYVMNDSLDIYIFNGKIFEQLPYPHINEWMNNLVDHEPSTNEMKEFIGRLRAKNVISRDQMQSSIRGKLCFQNGVLDIKTGVLEPHDIKFGFTNILPYNYDSTAVAPVWDKFMADIADGRERFADTLEQFCGYALAGDECYAQKALVLLGDGANGKSVFAETLSRVLGTYNTSAVSVSALLNDQARVRVVNKLLNYSDETVNTAFHRNDVLRSMITGGIIGVKEVYKPYVEYPNKAKILILANELPENKDLSDAMYRRLIIMDFTKQFFGADDDKGLKYKMWENELAGICNKFIKAYQKLVENKYIFYPPDSAEEVKQRYIRESNYIGQFCQECLEYSDDPNTFVSSKEVYSMYRIFCEDNNIHQEAFVVFMRVLSKYVDKNHVNIRFVRETINGVRNRGLSNCKMITTVGGY